MPTDDRPPYKPTRLCPHPWCRPLHTVGVIAGLLIIASDVIAQNWEWLWLTTLLTPVAYLVLRAAWNGKSQIDLHMEDTVRAGNGHRLLIVRPTWARIAVGMDFLHAASVGVLFSDLINGQNDRSDFDIPQGGALLVLLVAPLGGVWFWNYAHRKATEPAKPKTVTAFAPQGG